MANDSAQHSSGSQWRLLPGLVALSCLAGCAYTVIPNLRGTVLDATTHEPVAGALVQLSGRDGTQESAHTDARGRYAFNGSIASWGPPLRLVPTLRLRVSAPCYEPWDEVGVFPSFNSSHPPTRLPTALTRSCPGPAPGDAPGIVPPPPTPP